MANKTSDKILQSALRLMEQRGFHAISVKEIAAGAGVSEMTIFRHFETKMGILEAVVQKYSYTPYFESLFADEIVYDLEIDLLRISQSYLLFMEKNKPIFLIAVQERGTLPELLEWISEKNTMRLIQLLADYFTEMMNKERMVELDARGQAIAFLTSFFGFFVSTALWEDHFIHERRDDFVKTTVNTFIRGIGRVTMK